MDIRRGITSGCDAFFMPRDVTAEVLSRDVPDKRFKALCGAPGMKSKAETFASSRTELALCTPSNGDL